MSEFDTLLARYFENEISAEEQRRLLEACQKDDALRAELISQTRMHRSLRWLHHDADDDRFASELMIRLEPDAMESAAFVAGVIAKVHPAHAPKRKAWYWISVTAAAAALALLAGGFALKNGIAPVGDPAIASVIDEETHVAVITSRGPDTDVMIGRSLPTGSFSIASGNVGLSFAGGALLRVEGPAELMLLSPARARLIRGKASAHVPDGAQGFTIETPGVELVDLGTEFGVSVDSSGISDVHVFDGEVEARLSGNDADPGNLVALTTAQSRRFASDGVALDAAITPGDFPSPPSPNADTPRTQGAVHFLQQPPLSVETGHLESNEFILLFEERESVELTKETLVSFARPGRYSSQQKMLTKIRPPHQVSSYLVHYDPAHRGKGKSSLRREGSVTFARPIVGVIHKQDALNQTDDLFGHPSAVYDQVKGRGSERKSSANSSDVVVMSKDRRTLHFNLAVSGDLDQIRVLVKAPELRSR